MNVDQLWADQDRVLGRDRLSKAQIRNYIGFLNDRPEFMRWMRARYPESTLRAERRTRGP